MATDLSFVEYIVEQAAPAGNVSYKKMFGEYMIYVNAKPVILVCDNTAFVKILPQTKELLGARAKTGYPYTGAKLHYILNVDDGAQTAEAARIMERITEVPKKKRK